jgi:hypothetical protein
LLLDDVFFSVFATGLFVVVVVLSTPPALLIAVVIMYSVDPLRSLRSTMMDTSCCKLVVVTGLGVELLLLMLETMMMFLPPKNVVSF